MADRVSRRSAAAVIVSSALVGTVIVVAQVVGRDATSPPAATPAVEAKVWPQWDPRDVDLLPAAPDRIAAAIPEVIDPPASSPRLSDKPVGAAVLAVEHDGVAQVLGTDGDWRTVPIDGRYPYLSLSPGGTRLAVSYSYDPKTPEHDDGVTVHDLATGRSRELAPPGGPEPQDAGGWMLLDEHTLLFSSGPRAYVVRVDSGEAEETTAPGGISTTLDPAGNWLASADFHGPEVLTDYAGGTPRRVSMGQTGRLLRIQANEGTVVGTTYDGRPFSVVFADRKTLTPQSWLPVLDHDGNYSNWGLGAVAIADDGTVLLRVAAIGRHADGFRLVAWEPADGGLSIVSSTDLPVEASVVFSQAMLRAVGPD